jgi:PAS domain S-box-containing protein
MLGREPETLRALAVWDLLAEEDRERVRQRLTQPGEQGPSDLQCECRLVRRDGTTIWVDLLGSAAEFNGRAAVLVNVYDITGRKQADAKRRELTDLARIQGEQLIHAARLAELGEISAVVAHELNQPLTGINNFASNAGYMLEQGVGGPGEVQENLRRIKKQVKRTAEIISQIRQMARKSPPG